MIKNILTSAINAFYYLIFSIVFLVFTYAAKHFLLDGIIVSADVIHKMQEEYQLNLFDMNDEQLELIKMIAI